MTLLLLSYAGRVLVDVVICTNQKQRVSKAGRSTKQPNALRAIDANRQITTQGKRELLEKDCNVIAAIEPGVGCMNYVITRAER